MNPAFCVFWNGTHGLIRGSFLQNLLSLFNAKRLKDVFIIYGKWQTPKKKKGSLDLEFSRLARNGAVGHRRRLSVATRTTRKKRGLSDDA